MYLAKTPEILKPLASELTWNYSRDERVLYFTFDDGPTANYTREILAILQDFNAKATFFCIGGNAQLNPEPLDELLKEGHTIGNHTWNHMSGWEFSDFSYLRNVIDCSTVISSNLFRPPYGKIKLSQAKALSKRFEIVMWDVLSGDWDHTISKEKCLQNVTSNAQNGSIIVFHDSHKASERMRYALPKSLAYFSNLGFQFKAIPTKQLQLGK